MNEDLYIIQDGKKLRLGYTTGSCAVATTKAACIALRENKTVEQVEVFTPAGIVLNLDVMEAYRDAKKATCSIIKDGGDDPDATDGLEIRSTVTIREDHKLIIDGGEGIGRIMRKGFFGNIGDAAINPVPRRILQETLEFYSETGLETVISVPEGREVAKKTFNKHLGIEGGISILGTKGIVYPMSEEAYVKTFILEMDIYLEQGHRKFILTPGNYGEKIAKERNFDWPVIQVTNFLGEALRYLESKGVEEITVIGHIGNLAKTSIGIFNTHSKVADTRMEAFVYHLFYMEAPRELILEVDQLISAEEALKYCKKNGYGEIVSVMETGCNWRIQKYIRNDEIKINTIIYSMESGGEK